MKYTLTILTFALSVAIPASAQTAYSIVTPFTSTSAVKGCSSATDLSIKSGSGFLYPDEITSFTFGGTDPVTLSGPNPITGRVSLQNLVISKIFDNCSGSLITDFLTRQVIPSITIYTEQRNNTTNPPTSQAILTITLSQVVISQYSLNSAVDKPLEQIAFTFEKATVVAVTASGGTTTITYDGSLNQVSK